MNIKSLKEIGNPHYFGLGFIQLKINVEERLHFYHPEIMPILDQEEIHDHRYSFESTVIKGSLKNELFIFDKIENEKAKYGLFEVSCKKEDAGHEPRFLSGVKPIEITTFTCGHDQKYSLSHRAFHRIEYFEPTITHLKRGNIIKDYANVIKEKDAPAVCPFSKVMTQDELWEIIEGILNS